MKSTPIWPFGCARSFGATGAGGSLGCGSGGGIGYAQVTSQMATTVTGDPRDVALIRRAHAVHPIADLQIEYSLISRPPEARIFPLLSELGIGVTAYGVLSRRLLSGSTPQSPRDCRAHLPRFTGENRKPQSATD